MIIEHFTSHTIFSQRLHRSRCTRNAYERIEFVFSVYMRTDSNVRVPVYSVYVYERETVRLTHFRE